MHWARQSLPIRRQRILLAGLRARLVAPGQLDPLAAYSRFNHALGAPGASSAHRMNTFAQNIEEAAGGEPIEGIVIGEMGWHDFGTEVVPKYAQQPRGKLMDWQTAKPFLDYEHNTGYGAPKCNAIYAWTATKVIFVSQYDGSTSVDSIPRHPIDVMPEMPGG